MNAVLDATSVDSPATENGQGFSSLFGPGKIDRYESPGNAR
jgi:hypothetical protein